MTRLVVLVLGYSFLYFFWSIKDDSSPTTQTTTTSVPENYASEDADLNQSFRGILAEIARQSKILVPYELAPKGKTF